MVDNKLQSCKLEALVPYVTADNILPVYHYVHMYVYTTYKKLRIKKLPRTDRSNTNAIHDSN
ncbi:hypothetical protein EUTSA_v10022371mg [Eutrema salsugineum]|uniref:Uncharacterized protein n=1 Tax=Eutrema salsugineum TaxID=72664 RepID=V4LWT5_EUTSA|nr:hypothetical protein EUTSA_v10022371mg [Eutrema salsugineum]